MSSWFLPYYENLYKRMLSCDCVQIRDLKPDTRYMFTVRAENAFGLSVPSNTTETLRTLGDEARGVSKAQLEEARLRLMTRVISLKNLTPTGSTTVKVSWDVSSPTSQTTHSFSLFIYFFRQEKQKNFKIRKPVARNGHIQKLIKIECLCKMVLFHKYKSISQTPLISYIPQPRIKLQLKELILIKIYKEVLLLICNSIYCVAKSSYRWKKLHPELIDSRISISRFFSKLVLYIHRVTHLFTVGTD